MPFDVELHTFARDTDAGTPYAKQELKQNEDGEECKHLYSANVRCGSRGAAAAPRTCCVDRELAGVHNLAWRAVVAVKRVEGKIAEDGVILFDEEAADVVGNVAELVSVEVDRFEAVKIGED